MNRKKYLIARNAIKKFYGMALNDSKKTYRVNHLRKTNINLEYMEINLNKLYNVNLFTLKWLYKFILYKLHIIMTIALAKHYIKIIYLFWKKTLNRK